MIYSCSAFLQRFNEKETLISWAYIYSCLQNGDALFVDIYGIESEYAIFQCNTQYISRLYRWAELWCERCAVTAAATAFTYAYIDIYLYVCILGHVTLKKRTASNRNSSFIRDHDHAIKSAQQNLTKKNNNIVHFAALIGTFRQIGILMAFCDRNYELTWQNPNRI